jgi:ankyrin repeat protein
MGWHRFKTLFYIFTFVILLPLTHVAASQTPTAKIRDIDQKLIDAAREGNLEGVSALINKGANVNVRTEFGETPLHLAESREIARLLISKGADIHAKDHEFGMTPLFNASKEISEFLLSRGADVNAKGKKGVTPLAWAVYWDNIDKIEFLISKGADLNAGDENLKTPLHIAANWNKTEIAALLISRGANINARDESGWTPLHWASFEGGPEVIQLLISKGAEKNVKTTKPWAIFPAGSTPLDIADKAKFYDMVAFLKSKGCKRGKDMN